MVFWYNPPIIIPLTLPLPLLTLPTMLPHWFHRRQCPKWHHAPCQSIIPLHSDAHSPLQNIHFSDSTFPKIQIPLWRPSHRQHSRKGYPPLLLLHIDSSTVSQYRHFPIGDPQTVSTSLHHEFRHIRSLYRMLVSKRLESTCSNCH